ncbi:prophage MuSo1, positive regulator of late transcription, putative [Photobacterium marinum]|uniref:Prophage MuSo1, positive regulator of late transcription, putative n=1 Tax=Photobacterium marinum TaxID=1056511 RepID=L8JEM2_9GAMM|nr:Mor transcription activator family protein [Photobacterium marinum]ELR65867.1 prophage MuSo1, positive regulator of late transcription, putative [Photobacterium marinum]
MEQQQEIFHTDTSELELLINSVDDIADDNVRQRWPSTLQSLSEVLNCELKRANINNPHLADKLTIALGYYFGGRDIYIPTGNKLKLALRNIAIWREFNGRNIEQLAARYQLTERQITQVVKEQRQAEMQRRQRSLF